MTNATAPMISVTIQPLMRSVGMATRRRSIVLGGVGGQSGSGRGGVVPRAAELAETTNPVAGSRTWRVTRPS